MAYSSTRVPPGGAAPESLDPEAAAGVVCGRILIVDDEPNIGRFLRSYLTRLGHAVAVAQSLLEAVAQLEQESFDLVITDLHLGGASGLDLISVLRERWPGTRAILMSARADVHDASVAIERGIDQLIIKPFALEEVRLWVGKSLVRQHAERETQEKRDAMEARLRQREQESKVWVFRATEAMAAAVEAKDEYTAGHASRVTAYALILARAVGGIDLASFRLAGRLHDVGKIGVPDHVLNKPGRLTEEEFEWVKKHPVIGARILAPLIQDPLVLGVVRSHHERWDGTGYPDRLSGEAIPFPARILAIADTIDAMTSHRAYRRGLSWDEVADEVRRCAGTQFDPGLVRIFEGVAPDLHREYRTLIQNDESARSTETAVPAA